jgi:hypothetical protein
MKKLKTVVAAFGFCFLAGAQASPEWAWDAGKQTNNGAITIKSVSGGATYSGTQNPTGTVAKTNQNAVTQPPTVVIQGGGCSFTHSTFSRIVSGSGTLAPPEGAKAMRVAAVGAGGGGYGYLTSECSGGGGGGCAASKIVPAEVIAYSIGVGGNASGGSNVAGGTGGNTTASFGSYSLAGHGGAGGVTSSSPGVAAGGTGTGGDYWFRGGSAKYSFNNSSSGGGGAGPNGNGGDGGWPRF